MAGSKDSNICNKKADGLFIQKKAVEKLNSLFHSSVNY